MTMTTIPARPTLYKGTRMRSRLEADYASALDRAGASWEYEPVCFGAPDGQWLPDFKLSYPELAEYVEVKPSGILTRDTGSAWQRTGDIDEILRKMTAAWHSEPSALLRLVFWDYGCEHPDAAPLVIHGSRRDPWTVTGRGMYLPLIWPGLGAIAAAANGPLHDVAAEQRILGAMMLSADVIPLVTQLTSPADHYRPAHQLIHQAINRLHSSGGTADAVAVADELTRLGHIARCGGPQYLAVLIGAARPPAVPADARAIRHLAAAREHVEAAAAAP